MSRTLRHYISIVLLCLSFWSSGVFLIRFMSDYRLWSGWTEVLLFVVSPVVATVCIVAVRRALTLTSDTFVPTIVLITGLVVGLHGLVLILFPALYGDRSYLLPSVIWLVWFCSSVLLPLAALARMVE